MVQLKHSITPATKRVRTLTIKIRHRRRFFLYFTLSLFSTCCVCEILQKHTQKIFQTQNTWFKKSDGLGPREREGFSFCIFWPINSHSSPLSIYFTLFSSLYTQLLLWLCNKLIITHFTGTCGPHHNDPCWHFRGSLETEQVARRVVKVRRERPLFCAAPLNSRSPTRAFWIFSLLALDYFLI